MKNPFQTRNPNIAHNPRLRTPQREAYEKLANFALKHDTEREIGVVLPVGCGKSGCITLTPFAFRSKRCLVVAPNVKIAEQLCGDFDMSNPSMFYTACKVLDGEPYPESSEIRGKTTNQADLDNSHVVVTNIQQLQGKENRWLESLSSDFFDLMLFDEGHHNVAESWNILKEKFPNARVVNFSATPHRADGQLMSGNILYSYPVAQAIKEGYVKRLKAIMLNPQTLRYVRHGEKGETEVSLDEVRRLGEEDAGFRRSIVTSKETLSTIVDASIQELRRLRREAGENRLKIIASALNYAHCAQIVEAYRARGLKADHVHSRESGPANQKIFEKLENHQLDVIVQVRKLGEGFDHPWLTVAAVFSVFANLSPFIQFVGRIMRVTKHNAIGDARNRGSVVFHAGANVARRWTDFQEYSQADQEFFDQLLPMEEINFGPGNEIEVEPQIPGANTQIQVKSQSKVMLEEIPLIDDDEARAAIETLQKKGYTPEKYRQAYNELKPTPMSQVRQRQAKRLSLDHLVKNRSAQILRDREINPGGRELDRKHLGKTNLVVVKSAIDRQISAAVGRDLGNRHNFTKPELDQIERDFEEIVTLAIREIF